MQQHVSYKADKNYAVMNELKNGNYFGEISLLTNLSVTASIHTVSNTVWGRVHK